MKLTCMVSLVARIQSNVPINNTGKYRKALIALCRNPRTGEPCFMLFTLQGNKLGTKYPIKNNIKQVLTRFVNEGKSTIQFINPPHDVLIQADVIPLKGFLHLLRRILSDNVPTNELSLSSMAMSMDIAKDVKKMVITKRSDYPSKGFPRTLESLIINDIQRCSVDLGILSLTRLKQLDLSDNLIAFIPMELNALPKLCELHLENNRLGAGAPSKWDWLSNRLCDTLSLLNLKNNNMTYLPDQVTQLKNLITLFIDSNEIKILPSRMGNLKQLKAFSASYNQLIYLPGSIATLRFHSLDLSYNNFDDDFKCTTYDTVPKKLPLCSLKELSARKVVNSRLFYSPEIVPRTICNYMSLAKLCICGNTCVDVYVKFFHMFPIRIIVRDFRCSSDRTLIPIEYHFCSLECLYKNTRRYVALVR